MYKQLRFLTTMLLLAVCCGTWADTYKLVTSANELSQGDIILIAAAKEGTSTGNITIMGAPATNNCTAVSTTITGDVITELGNGQEIELESVNTSGYFTMKVGESSYLYAANSASGKNNYLKTKSDNNIYWSISIDAATNAATIKDQVSSCNSRNWLRYNSSSALFSCYGSGQDNVYIFKKQVTSNLDPSNFALTGTPVALNFDLYDNKTPQVINYTTSSTGAVTVSESDYVTTTVNNGTITVTPVKVTPTEQTITVYQAATDTYAAGSASFTVTIGDSTPFTGGDVTFDATVDKGSSSLIKNGVTFSCNNGVLGNGSEYRLYKNSTTTFSLSETAASQGFKITSVAFTGVSGNPASGFAGQTGWTTDGNNGTWTGAATSVSFEASGAQVRATQIVVTVDTSDRQPAGLAYETTEYYVNLGETFSTPTLTNPNNLSVSYASSNESVATVNEETGAVTIIEAGTTTITASSEETEQYLAGSATYTLKVVDPNAPNGTIDSPYRVQDVINGTATGNVYVKGYIVGEYVSNADPHTSGFTTDANIAIADEFTTAPTASGSIPVQLPTNALKSAWGNQTNNGEFITYEVLLKGNVETYFTVNGIKGTSEVTATGVYVKIASSGKSSYCASDDIELVDGVNAYIVTNVTSTSATMTQLTGAVPANEGIMLVGTGGAEYTLPIATEAASVSGNLLVGTASGENVQEEAGKTYLALKNGEFVVMNPGTVKPHKAYLSVDSSVIGESSKLAITYEENNATAINEVQTTKEDGVFYNLNGMRVSAPQKGIYILNGKKIIVK